jgi:hypothetical protein
MRDLHQALADISDIRGALAAGTMFRGFGPAVVAITGGLAFAMATAQSIWPQVFAADDLTFLDCWVATAVLAAALLGVETFARSRRYHGGLSNQMMLNAVERFLPAGFAGAALAVVLAEFAPETVWMLPGLWQILLALGIFAALPSLPRAMGLAGGWYFVTGVAMLIVASAEESLSPWMMGVPFTVGQLLAAIILHFASGGSRVEDED